MGVSVEILMLVGGLFLLVVGGNFLVSGAAGLARNLGVSSLIIGLTVVSFGTSAPELAVNTQAALAGSTALSFGNIIGSNIANIALILACGALVRPLHVGGSVVPREIPTMLLATAFVVLLALDDGLRGEPGVYDRMDGWVLLLVFCIFIYNAARDAVRQRSEAFRDEVTRDEERRRIVRMGRNLAGLAVGLACLIFGADITVRGATGIAVRLNVDEVVIGLTIVAFGTSLPELVATVIAARRGETELAVGNVIGSNIFNLLFVMGVTATLQPIELPAGAGIDLLVLSVLSVLTLVFSITNQRRIVRYEGVMLLVLYITYIAWTFGVGRV